VDTAWAAQVDRDMGVRGEKLEQELKLYKSNQIKESVRVRQRLRVAAAGALRRGSS